MREVNLDTIFFNHTGCHPNSRIYTAMKEACKQAIELCAENAKAYEFPIDMRLSAWVDPNPILITINQIK